MKIFLFILLAFTLQAKAIPAAHTTVKVDLKEQVLFVAVDGKPIFSTPVETGSSEHPTLPGTYYVSLKEVTYFSKFFQMDFPYFLRLNDTDNKPTFFAIHYYPSHGKFTSHGSICINDWMTAKRVYDLIPLGTEVFIQ
jgi:lipoprotein-anchoring transpeptidase ErfK/SrfK